MLFDPKCDDRLARLTKQLRLAPALTPDLFSNVIAEGCTRLPALSRTGQVARIDRLIAAGAWTEAALALVELELPTWKLRRLVYEDGEWLCSLSRQPNLPMGLDDTADAGHEVLPLAVLGALVAARRRAEMEDDNSPSTVPQVRPMSDAAICCDNFA
jgi:MYXO-CTERM domain-containing protein